MSVTSRVIALSLITTLLGGGPLAPLARAQQPQPMLPQSGLFQESLKATQGETPERSDPVVYDAAAAVADLFYIPGKVGLCGLGLGVGMAILALTFGSGYRWAGSAWHEGCGGKWVLTGRDFRPSESAARGYDWDQDPSR